MKIRITKTSLFGVMTASAMALAIGMTQPVSAAECIAPANPGGGWDFTCRTISKIMHDIGVVDKPIQVTNMAGGGGGLAYSHVVTKRNTDGEVIVAASSATATRLAQDKYAGMTYDQVRFLGSIGGDYGVIAVAKDAPYENLGDLIEAVKTDPASITFAGGSAAGGFDHLKVLMALKKAEFTDITKVKYVGLDGGGDAITQMLGGHVQAMTGDISEVVGFMKSGDVRVIAIFAEERLPGDFNEIPTAKEQGFDVIALNWRGLYVPKGISDDEYKFWADALAKVGQSEEWKVAMEANGLLPFYKVGDDFQDYVGGLMEEIATLSRDIGVIK